MTKIDPARAKYGHLLEVRVPPNLPPKVNNSGHRIVRGIGFGLAALVALVIAVLGGFRVAATVRETATADSLAPTTGQFVATRGGRVYLQDAGPRDGIPVVLIHGTAAWSEFWRGTIDHLAANKFRVIAIDLPPFGFSERSPAAAYTRADQAERIVGVLDALKIDRAIWVGHSFGAGATVETVMRHPTRTRGLILIAAALGLPEPGQTPPPPSAVTTTVLSLPLLPEALIATTATNPLLTRQLLASMLARKDKATPALADVLRYPMTQRNSTADFARWAKYFIAPDLAALSMTPGRYADLPGKTRLIWGDLDTLTPLPQGQRLQQLMPGATLDVIRGVGHIPQVEDPAAFRAVLVRLLAEVP